MNKQIQTAFAVSALVFAVNAAAQVTFYEGEGFRGRAFTTSKDVLNFARIGFNDRASSVTVANGRWEVCEDARYDGRCVLLRPGNYDSLRSLGMENRISSVRRANNRRNYAEQPEPQAVAAYDWRRRPNEQVYNAPVTSVRAVMGTTPEQHCWVERQQVSEPARGDRNVGGAIAGALIGGVLGHQVGGGTGKDIATVGGAVAGGVIGSNVGRDGNTAATTRDVRRCDTATAGTPAYWDVNYSYRGLNHQVQMTSAPGPTIAVNAKGEPRQ